MTSLTNAMERKVLDWLCGVATPQPTAPIMVRLMGTAGSDETPGVEVTGGMYEAKSAGFSLASTTADVTSVKNVSAAITWPALDAVVSVSVAAVELWDSSPEPVRIAHKTYGAPIVVPPGETAVLDIATLSLTLD